MKLHHVVVASLLMLWLPGYAQRAVTVQIPVAGIASSPAALPAYLFQPPGADRHPAVVMLHGCGGAYGKNGKLNPRHQMWGQYLAAQGYVALLPDSFSPRGYRQICSTKLSQRTLKEADRVGDAYAALAYLRQLAGVDPEHVALLGWSHGAGVALDAVTRRPDSAAGTAFRAVVAFYPGCTSRNKKADNFHPYAPLLLLMGESDDWTPAAPCKALAARVAARGEPMQIITYADTFHDFDNPSLKGQHLRQEVPNGVIPGAGVTTAPNPAAREDAKQRVIVFLDQHLH